MLFTKAIDTFDECAKLNENYSPVFLELIKAHTLQLLLKVRDLISNCVHSYLLSLIQVNDSPKIPETKAVLPEVAKHCRRIAFIYADDARSPKSAHLGQEAEGEAQKAIEDLYDFLKRLFDKAILKMKSENVGAAGTQTLC